jgi:hypothetical protein
MKNVLKTFSILSILTLLMISSSNSNILDANQIAKDISSSINLFQNPLGDLLEIRRGGGFGGSRRGGSFGKRRSSGRTKSNRRSSAPKMKPSPKRPSFGGKRMSSAQAKKQYGTPTKQSQMSSKNAQGVRQNYTVNHYGGYGSGLMMGYMAGSSMWYWSMPFHPAYYYSRPRYVENTDGTVGVYPPTFSFTKVLFSIIIVFVIIFVVKRLFFSRSGSNSSRGGSSGSFS